MKNQCLVSEITRDGLRKRLVHSSDERVDVAFTLADFTTLDEV